MSSEAELVLPAVVLIALTAYYTAARTALSHMSVHRAEKLREEGSRGAGRLVRLLRDPTRTLSILNLVVLLAQTLALALVAVAAFRLGVRGPLALAAVAVGVALLLFVVADVAPRTLALQRPEKVACASAWSVAAVVRPLGPLAALLIRLGSALAPGRRIRLGPPVTTDEIREMVDIAREGDVIEESEREMLHAIFELGDTVVREIMVPRPDMVVASADAPLREVLDVILRAGHSRVPVYRGSRDKIVGLVYAKDVLRRIHLTGDEEGSWAELIREAAYVPELKPVGALLRDLQAAKVHMAIVVDEYGATAGVVTIEDILEEIVGEIVDEYDREDPLVENLGGDRYRVDGRLPVDDFCELLDVTIPEGEWDTVGGLVFSMLGHVPEPGERAEVDGLALVAERVMGRRIGTLLVERIPPAAAQAGAKRAQAP